MDTNVLSVGDGLRKWRTRRRLSQLELACEAEISARHLSFLETGRSRPSRDMILRLSEHLAVPLRERNLLLLAAGFAPLFKERDLDDPALEQARAAIDLVLSGHEPYPALAIDRHWTLVAANRMVTAMMAGIAPALLEPPVNVLRASLHPEGLAPRIVNLGAWRHHILSRLRQQIDTSADQVLLDLHDELASFPAPSTAAPKPDYGGVVVPLRLETDMGALSLFGTTTVFGTPIDITLSELAIEAFYPADPETAERLRRIAGLTD